ncbi:hypothetical protein XA68_16624 [Ophiocordyceps unilateralis]|uniref:Uncharacterized protein n=1 Tax=Ophiocordyceps unilateralis TaxID=268505 RepID=A0A2A9PNV4_OPHUN|nr:hypothetical protein XA68_16624 [Ophiocordyceps unilateralis]
MGKSHGEMVSFLDGGGAEPLRKGQPANDKTSKQYFLISHLYTFFASLLHCSKQGNPGFDAYNGHSSMYKVHKFMGLNHAQVSYFIQQVGLAAQSFGMERADVDSIAASLNMVFNVRCAPPAVVIPAQGPQLQSICIDGSCPMASGAMCEMYTGEANASSSSSSSMGASNSGNGTGVQSRSGSVVPSSSDSPDGSRKSAASTTDRSASVAAAAVAFGFVALML